MFERDGQAVYFGVTAVENIFLTELMPAAKGDFVKVYLAALFHSGQKEEDLTVSALAQELGQTQAQVEAALRYWERRGALSYIASDPPVYRLYSLTQRALTGQDAVPQADEAFVEFSESVYALFGDERKVRPAEIATAYEWVVDEGLTPEAVLTLLCHMMNTAGKQFSFKKAGETAARPAGRGGNQAAGSLSPGVGSGGREDDFPLVKRKEKPYNKMCAQAGEARRGTERDIRKGGGK